jgi:hypothetical protein
MSLFGFNWLNPAANSTGTGPFDLDAVLMQVSESDFWRVRDAIEGTQIFGTAGSGKTTGSGNAIARAFLRHGFGGLVLTAKPDERALWEQYAKATGRSNDLVVFAPGEKWRFNFLDYEFRRTSPGGGETENLVRLFYTVLELSEGVGKGRGSDPFWERAVKQMLRNAIEVVAVSEGAMRLNDLYQLMLSAPTSIEQACNKKWQAGSFCFKSIENGGKKTIGTNQEADFDHAALYWLREYPALADRTRSVVLTSFTSMADCFLRGKLRELFCTTTNLVPEDTHDGRIVILDLPVKQWAELGRFSQVLFKHLWQQAAERRDISANSRPIFLWADEAQFFVTRQDAFFQTTARSARVATVYLTQNLPNYFAILGDNKHETDSLMGNLSTKIFHANGDPTTNQWAADIFSRSWQTRSSSGFTEDKERKGGSHNIGYSDALEYDVLPQSFTRLSKGGPHNEGLVDGIVFQGGRTWNATGRNSLRVRFRQP